MALKVLPVVPADAAEWLRMRRDLWPAGDESEHRAEIEAFFAGTAPEPQAVLLARGESGRALGFAELSIRPYAEGCRTQRVAYLEGWYVAPDARARGVGRALIEAVADWGRSQGCSELASDAEVANEVSRRAHCSVGFEDVGLVRCFRMDL